MWKLGSVCKYRRVGAPDQTSDNSAKERFVIDLFAALGQVAVNRLFHAGTSQFAAVAIPLGDRHRRASERN
jgi:hypothetical protein